MVERRQRPLRELSEAHEGWMDPIRCSVGGWWLEDEPRFGELRESETPQKKRKAILWEDAHHFCLSTFCLVEIQFLAYHVSVQPSNLKINTRASLVNPRELKISALMG